MSGPKFYVGQRVRMVLNNHAETVFGTLRYKTGTVVKVFYDRRKGDRLRIRRGKTVEGWSPRLWEPIPPGDLTRDETCVQLAHAVLAGETDAALALADRLFELSGGTQQ